MLTVPFYGKFRKMVEILLFPETSGKEKFTREIFNKNTNECHSVTRSTLIVNTLYVIVKGLHRLRK